MVQKIPPSSKQAFIKIREIISLGTIDIPNHLQGTGAPGNTLEYLVDVYQNNTDTPDLLDWELKFHGGGSLLTLLHKEPEPLGIMDKVVDTFGWPNKNGNISFRHTIRGKSKRGFVITDTGNKITVTIDSHIDIVPYWDHNVILGAIGAKLRRLILVQGTVSSDKRKVTYKNATAYWNLKFSELCPAIESGIILIDFDARTKEGRGTSLRNHGTKFRINIKNLGSLYENVQII